MRELARIFESDSDIIAVILFGSWAKRAMTPLSDIDICVVTGPDLDRKRREELLSHSSRLVELHWFWDLPLAVRFRMLREGIVLVERDPLLFHRVATATVREYLDFEPVLRRHCEQAIRG